MKKNNFNQGIGKSRAGKLGMKLDDIIPEKLIERDELEKCIDEYLKNGGTITRLKIDYNDCVDFSSARGSSVEDFFVEVL
jgi:hypothetical protein